MACSGVMKDSYVGSINSSSCIQQNDSLPFCVTVTDDEPPQMTVGVTDDKLNILLFGGNIPEWAKERSNQTDEDKIINLTCSDEAKATNINKTEEYNIGYSGISILPWEEFAFNPRVLNDLFYTESNSRITYDPDEVNVFFHGKNVMPPTVGDISENGKSWNIDVDNINDLRKIRKMLTERCSVFGVTLEYKEKSFGKPVRAPCLVLLDPNQAGLGDRLYTTITKCMDTLHNQRRFCVEINLNVCVERWCKSVLLTDCKVVGAKLYVTNGEEYTPLNESTEDKVCCVLCFPIWLLQTAIYKLHRFVTYDDYRSDLDAEEIFLHGSFQDAQFQRQQIFKGTDEQDVFRIRSAQQTDVKTLQALGTHKFVCVKKVEKVEDVNFFKEHNTSSFGTLIDKRKEKVLHKDRKMSGKKKQNNKRPNEFEIGKDSEEGNMKDAKIKDTNFVNQGYSSSEYEEESDDADVSPRIPEIGSVACKQDREETVEVEISPEVEEREHNMFIKMTPSLDQDALDIRMQKAERDVRDSMQDSKSMTAVKSFQIDTESETDSSEEDVIQRAKNEVSKSKDNFIEEMMKIEKTLPKIQTKDKDEGKAASLKTLDTEKKTKSKKRIMFGQAFKEITKTTEKPVTKKENTAKNNAEPTVDDKKTEKSKLVLKTPDSINTSSNVNIKSINEINKRDNDKIDSHCKKIKTPKPEFINQSDKVNELPEDENNKIDIKKSEAKNINNSNDMVQESKVSTINIEDSSSDGDEVEMIYQSERSIKAGSKDAKYRNKDIQLFEAKPDAVGSETEKVAKVNNSATNKTISVSNTNGKKTTDIKEDDKKDSGVNGLQENDNDILADPLFGVTKVETALDITDIDDVDEVGNEASSKTFVPPLKLSEKLSQKAKRVNKQYSSKMKYLGVSVPQKVRRK